MDAAKGDRKPNDFTHLNGASPNAPLLRSSLHHDGLPFNNTRLVSVLNCGPRLSSGVLMRPLVALLDGRDCSVEMGMLKDLATVAFCDAQNASEIHERVLNEAVVALVCHSIRLHREDLQRFKCLKAIIRIGPGIEQFDLSAATQMGIAVCHTPVQCIEERADSTLSLILDLYRKTHWTAKSMQGENRLQSVEQLREIAVGSPRMRGSRLLIVGLGQVGTAVGLRATAFGFSVSFYDPLIADGCERALGFTRHANLDEAVAQADCISFHCPLTSKTKHFVNMALMKRMKKGIFIVNINSEQLFDESDLLANLRSGHIGAAAFDCHDFVTGSSVANNLLHLPNVICTPGLSWYSDVSCRELREAAARETRRVLTGKFPKDLQYCVNKEALLSGFPLLGGFPSGSPANSAFMSSAMRGTNDFLNYPSTSAYQVPPMFNANNVMPSASTPLIPGSQGIFNQFAQMSALSNGNTPSPSVKRKRSITPRDDRPSSSSSTNHTVGSTTSGQVKKEGSEARSSIEPLAKTGAHRSDDQEATRSSSNEHEENERPEVDEPTAAASNDSSPAPKSCRLEENPSNSPVAHSLTTEPSEQSAQTS